MLKRFNTWVRACTAEDIAVAVFGATFFVGVWYAFPMPDVFLDAWAYGGGVLRALEAHSIFPGPDVLYGTLTFYVNYVFTVVVLAIGLLFNGFHISTLKEAFIFHPEYSLLIPRITSALVTVALMLFVYRFLKEHVSSVVHRLALLMLVFGNVLTAVMTRSGKMWVLSTALGVVSFVYLYQSMTQEVKNGRPGKYALISVLAAFLALANFTFAFIYLINIPLILYIFPKTKASLLRLFYIVATGTAVCLAVFATNAKNIIAQFMDVFSVHESAGGEIPYLIRMTIPESIWMHFVQVVEALPLLIVLLLILAFAVRSKLQDKKLAYLSLIYLAAYFVLVSVVSRWSAEPGLHIRYVWPVIFPLFFLVVAFRPPARWVSAAFLGVGMLVYAYSVFLLSTPSTYNSAYDHVVSTYGSQSIRIESQVRQLALPMNKRSYSLLAPGACGSACQYRLAGQSDIAFAPTVVTMFAATSSVAELPPADIIVTERDIQGCMFLARFGNAVKDEEFFDVEHNLGRVLLPTFYGLRQLGRNIYIYDGKSCPQADVSTARR